ncbi:unnamed protein product [Adineta ricciae]|uniref:Uncharacterized protein n=1 Tax=Adineta ricciae TaxID=249248 RepID=A0A814DND4_ADIRI|nr:unnamed protein product [Adineta ricciae]CAF0958106.1 unnamed protein product [Adineta ricciae]
MDMEVLTLNDSAHITSDTISTEKVVNIDKDDDDDVLIATENNASCLPCLPYSVGLTCLFAIFTALSMLTGILIVYYKIPKPPNKTCLTVLKAEARSLISDESRPLAITVADLNKDGLSDVIVANSGANTIGIFFRKDQHSFAKQITYSTGVGSIPYAVIADDFNNDQQLDLAIANYGHNNIGIFLGTTNATFPSQTTFSTGPSRPLAISGGDFNNDTFIDLAVVTYGTNSVYIYLGNGRGHFVEVLTLFTGFDSIPYALAVTDLDNDDQLDMIVANYGTNNVGIFFGRGNVSFEQQLLIDTGVKSQPHSIAVNDLNDDNYMDIVIVCSGTNSVDVLLNIENRSFATLTKYFTGKNSLPVSSAIGDFDQDNKLDIVVVNYVAGNIVILFNRGNGFFTEPATFFTSSDYYPNSIAISDFNLDSYVDMAIVEYDHNYLDVIPTHREYSFVDQRTYRTTGIDSEPISVFLADFDNDDQLDMVVANYWLNNIAVFLKYDGYDFLIQQTYYVGNGYAPYAVTSADFNNDNRADIAVANYWGYNMGIFLNIGNGSFSSQRTYSTGNAIQPCRITTGDFNNDNWMDVVVVNCVTNSIGIFINTGNGSFAHQVTYSTGSGSWPMAVIVDDFNEDRCLDIAVANNGANSIGIFSGYGNGTFASQLTYGTGTNSAPHSIASGDIDGDNLTDIVVANYLSSNVVILRGYGNGSFQLQNTLSAGSSAGPQSLVLADIDNDHLLDVILVSYLAANLGVFLGRSDGNFSTQITYSTGLGSLPYSVVVGDMNKDGQLDAVVANYGTSCAGIFIGYGNGSFAAQKIYSTRGDANPWKISVADVNYDNRLDLIVVNYASNYVDIFLANNNGTFYKYMTYSTGSNSAPNSITIADLNGDNLLDMVTANYGTNNVGIFIGYKDGTFSNQITYSTDSYSTPRYVAVDDLNNDTYPDLAVANYGTSTIGLFFGFGDGTFADQKTFPTTPSSGPQYIIINDFNNDNRLDMAVLYTWTDNVGIFFGYGNGTFSNQVSYPFAVGSRPYSMTAGDVNHDNQVDLIVTIYYSRVVVVMLGQKDGTFITAATYSTGSNSRPYSVVVGDWNRDNNTDIAVANCNSNNVLTLEGNGDGTFGNSATYSTGDISCPEWINFGDFNNDSLLDLVVANYASNTLGVFLGFSYIKAVREGTYSTGSSPRPRVVNLGDFNHDDKLDVAIANYQLGDVGILLGHPNGSYPTQNVYSIDDLSFPTSLAIGNLNNDSYLDICVANSGTESVTVLYGNGNGSFAKSSLLPTGLDSVPQSLVVNDFNNDKLQDIVVVSAGTNNVFAFLKYDTGSLKRQTSIKTGDSTTPRSISVDDFNKDGRLDFVILNSGNNNFGIFLGLGNGTFSTQMTYSTGQNSNPWSLRVHDIDQDDCLDIIVTNSWSNTIGIFLGLCDGTFSTQMSFYTAYNSGPEAFAIADFDNDTQWDVVVCLEFIGQISILYEYQNSTFSSPVFYTIGTYTYPSGVAVADLNYDNHLDMVVINYGTSNLALFYGRGNRTFANPVFYTTGNSSNPSSVVLIDLDKDGNMDIIVGNSGADNICVFYGRSDGTTYDQEFFATGAGSTPYQIVVRDVNNDKRFDIIVANYGSNSIGVLLGCQNRSFFSQLTYSTGDYSQPRSIALGDFNVDGRLDAVVANFGTGSAGIFLGYSNYDFLGAPASSTGSSSHPNSIAAADFNNDNQLDIIIANNGTNNVLILFGTGYGTFTNPVSYPTGTDSHPCWVAVADLNQDTLWDFVVANSGTNNIGVFLANSTGLFSSQVTYSTGSRSRPYSVTVLDFNNDTRLDIVVASYGANNVGIFYGYGNGSFMDQEIFPTGFNSHPYALTFGDINNDNLTDVIVTNNGYGNIDILMKTC